MATTLLAPAVHYDALEHPDIAPALANAGRIQIFHSNKDSVLSVYAALRHAAPMLGAIGPNAAASLPKNIVIYNVTERLGGKDVHGRYLKREGLGEISLAKALGE